MKTEINNRSDKANSIAGVINIYKEKGYTSHDVVNIVRKCMGKIKTGHTGTLDPDAEGVLPVCIGKATKLADYIQADTKKYRAVIKLGITTTTEDTSGEILTQTSINIPDDAVRAAIQSFVGEYNQKPPMYSAVKVNGKKLYELARQGKEVERKTRLIHIYDITDIQKLTNDCWQFEVLCSKGTYIRTLCSDIGKKLGCGGCMAELVRTASGRFSIEKSIKLQDFKDIVEQGCAESVIIPMEEVLSDFNTATVVQQANKYLYNGNKISLNYVQGITKNGERLLVKDSAGSLIGIYAAEEDCIKPLTMLI